MNFQARTHEPSITWNIFIFTVKGDGFCTPEHAIKSLFSCFKNRSDDKFDCFKSPEIMSMSRMAPVDLNCEISHVSSEKLCYNACFCGAHRRKNRIKMVVPEVLETRDTIKFCIKCGYKPPEIMFFVTNRWGCFRNEKVQRFSSTRGLSKDKRAFKMALGADAGR